ncbi:hypothetical protein QBC40DRAFT_181740 [Triangularia verruculosa]|uniref:Uncharacterized protein n=1 Tax=Triangularia verruculosa TaxID=2587418 RepID=A0AAN6XBE2_9PEZI|nr:hypothetical protein QBC40DRAFT_181740 [Triangularia verruculosa]
MCHRSECISCHKTTWTGCGHHIPNIMDNIPREEWCTCTPRVKVSCQHSHRLPEGSPEEFDEYPPRGPFSSACELL